MTHFLSEEGSRQSQWRGSLLAFLFGVIITSMAWFVWHESRMSDFNARLEPWAQSEIALALFRHLGANVYVFENRMAKRFWDDHGFDTICLQGSNVTDADMALIAGASDIRALDLSNTGITDKCLSTLATLPNLKHLNLRRTQVTAEGLRQFSKKAPHCLVNDKSWDL
jgi:hypothetical protein